MLTLSRLDWNAERYYCYTKAYSDTWRMEHENCYNKRRSIQIIG